MLKEERKAQIATNQALLKSSDDDIRLRQLRKNRLKTTNEFQKCDELSSELRELLKEKCRTESLLAVLHRKERKSQWHLKKQKSRSKRTMPKKEIKLKFHPTCIAATTKFIFK